MTQSSSANPHWLQFPSKSRSVSTRRPERATLTATVEMNEDGLETVGASHPAVEARVHPALVGFTAQALVHAPRPKDDETPPTDSRGRGSDVAERVGFEPTDRLKAVPALAVRSIRPGSGTSPSER